MFVANQKLQNKKEKNHKHICSYCFTRFKSKAEKTKHIENEHLDTALEPIDEIHQVKNAKNMWEKVFQKTQNQVDVPTEGMEINPNAMLTDISGKTGKTLA